MQIVSLLVLHHHLYEPEEVLVVHLYQLIEVWHVGDLLLDLLTELFIVEHERQGRQAYQPGALYLRYLRLLTVTSEAQHHREGEQEELAVHVVLAEFLYLSVNEHPLWLLGRVLRILEIEADLGQLLVSLLESVLLQQFEELLLLGRAVQGDDLLEEALIEWIDRLDQLVEVILGTVILVDAIDEQLHLVDSLHHLLPYAEVHLSLVPVVLEPEVLEHTVSEILHAEQVLQIELDLILMQALASTLVLVAP